ncbi:dual specificity protein phosphatase 13A-like [Ambystoma mexicanum]|uniref:dual specificity protein phosphatase 13A-like n=1 Tax=Ambystoma mexicanum TaxID=8296 RepID=UPI0037E927A0
MTCTGEQTCASGSQCFYCCNQFVCMTQRSGRECGTPTFEELHAVLQRRARCSQNPADEVWPNLYLGNASSAMDTDHLQCVGITHVLNAADYHTGPYYYPCIPISYFGITAEDAPTYDIGQHFCEASKFIDQALKTPGGKVLVHCCETGLSRNSTLVLAYLMIYRNRTLMEAICLVTKKRYIQPNDGFIQQLQRLDEQLNHERSSSNWH